MKKPKLIYFIIIISCCAFISNAQEKVEGLVINEVYFNESDSSQNWMEIYNPSKEPLTLSIFSLSTFLTPNLLQNKEIIIDKDGYIILCASENFKSKMKRDENKIIVFSELKMLDKGGIVTIGIKEKGIDWYDTIKYGEDLYSKEMKGITNKKIIPFSANGKSFSRKKDKELIAQSDFYETEPTPLEINK